MNNTETLTASDTQDTGQNKHQSKQKGQSRMINTQTLTASDTQDTGQNKHQSKQKGQLIMNNTETLATSDTQDTGQINTRVNRRKIKNEQHRDTVNIVYTRQNKHQSKQN